MNINHHSIHYENEELKLEIVPIIMTIVHAFVKHKRNVILLVLWLLIDFVGYLQ